MPKKDTASAVLGMLSSVGAQTKPPVVPPGEEPAPAPRPEGEEPAPNRQPPPSRAVDGETDQVAGSVSALPTARKGTAPEEAPRTLRLRPNTALRLRAAWLEAKRDDVLLTAQDFASDLVEEALARRRRRSASSR